MPLNVSRLRMWFATSAVLLAAVVAGFYFYGRMRVRHAMGQVPRHLGVDIQQSTEGFTLSKSEGGRTLFTIHAARAVQFKDTGKAELRDVSIIVYGRQSNRYDQIYGADFEYDPRTGNASANGEVTIDLEGNSAGPVTPDQAPPPELKNPIHLKTSGLSFNARTGVASTKERIEFRIPQASGSAIGASYDSKAALLTLDSDIQVHSADPSATRITARHGVIAKGPNRAVLQDISIKRESGSFAANELTIYLRDDNTIEHVAAFGDVRAESRGAAASEVRSSKAEAWITDRNAVRTALFYGGVALRASGEQPMQGTAGKVTVNFAAQNRAQTVIARDGVKLLQQPGSNAAHPVELAAGGIDFLVKNGRTLQKAVTSGPAQIRVLPLPGASGQDSAETVATAGGFQAEFDRHNRISRLTGAPEAKVVSSMPGQPAKTSTSDGLQVAFNSEGGIATIVQIGHFHYSEPAVGSAGERAAWADHARYTPGDQVLNLTGSPRIIEGGLTTTAQTIRFDRRTGDAFAAGDVKSTYSELKPQPGGALLASGDPIHATAPSMHAIRATGMAVYSGGARLWQGASIVQAPLIEFSRADRKLIAKSTNGTSGAVTTTFLEQDKAGKLTPVNIRSSSLVYVDSDRQARFQGRVVVRGADATLTADYADVSLQRKVQNPTPSPQSTPSQIEKIVAAGNVNIQEPNRRATGEKLVYTAAEGKFVLTGGSPSIFDAERGQITGGSLTFYNRDGRVVVESTNSSPTVTLTRITK